MCSVAASVWDGGVNPLGRSAGICAGIAAPLHFFFGNAELTPMGGYEVVMGDDLGDDERPHSEQTRWWRCRSQALLKAMGTRPALWARLLLPTGP